MAVTVRRETLYSERIDGVFEHAFLTIGKERSYISLIRIKKGGVTADSFYLPKPSEMNFGDTPEDLQDDQIENIQTDSALLDKIRRYPIKLTADYYYGEDIESKFDLAKDLYWIRRRDVGEGSPYRSLEDWVLAVMKENGRKFTEIITIAEESVGEGRGSYVLIFKKRK